MQFHNDQRQEDLLKGKKCSEWAAIGRNTCVAFARVALAVEMESRGHVSNIEGTP